MFPKLLQHFAILLVLCEASKSSPFLPTIGIVFLFKVLAILVDIKWYIVVVLVCIPLLTNYVQHLLMCVMFVFPKNSRIEILILNVMIFGRRTFGRWLNHKSGALMNGIHAYITETPESSPALSVILGNSEKTLALTF